MKSAEDIRQMAHTEAEKLKGLNAEIGLGLANGKDVRALEKERRFSCDRSQALLRAAQLVEEEAQREEQKARRNAEAKMLVSANEAASKLHDLAEDLDSHLATLDKLYADVSLASLDLQNSARRAGLADGGRIAAGIRTGMRYALHKHADGFAQDVQSSRVPANNRMALSDTVARLMPAGIKLTEKEQAA